MQFRHPQNAVHLPVPKDHILELRSSGNPTAHSLLPNLTKGLGCRYSAVTLFPTPVSTIVLFGTPVQLFTLFVGAAILVGALVMDREMERLGFSTNQTSGLIFLVLLIGLYTSHFVTLFVYNFDRLKDAGLMDYLDPFNGMSSTGGFLGAAAAFLLMRGRLKEKFWPVADAAILSTLAAWVIARLGCTFAFDHPGGVTAFFLGFEFRDGQTRHNLGFYEMLFTLLVLNPAAWTLKVKQAPPGSLVAMACLLYAPVRFLMDFLRATDLAQSDTRFIGLTFAQYACVFFFIIGVRLFRKFGTRKVFGFT